MSTQPNPITPDERPQSIRESPVSQQNAARFLEHQNLWRDQWSDCGLRTSTGLPRPPRR